MRQPEELMRRVGEILQDIGRMHHERAGILVSEEDLRGHLFASLLNDGTLNLGIPRATEDKLDLNLDPDSEEGKRYSGIGLHSQIQWFGRRGAENEVLTDEEIKKRFPDVMICLPECMRLLETATFKFRSQSKQFQFGGPAMMSNSSSISR